MKRKFCFLLAVSMLLFFTACGRKPAADFSVAGVWNVSDVNIKKSDDALMKTAVANVLGVYITEGMTATFKDDGTGNIGDKPVAYVYENSKLTITWDSSKNFTFDVTQTGKGFDVKSSDVFAASFVK